MNLNQPPIIPTPIANSMHKNVYSLFRTNTSDITTPTTPPTTTTTTTSIMTKLNRKKRVVLTTDNQRNKLFMTTEQSSSIFSHNPNATNVLSFHHLNENQLNNCKKEHCREHQRRKRASLQYRHAHAARERQRVAEFNKTFKKLRNLIPSNLSGRRLSKLQILKLCSA
ncbi:Helix-loop-helix protein, partial [Schistosoma japonicum]